MDSQQNSALIQSPLLSIVWQVEATPHAIRRTSVSAEEQSAKILVRLVTEALALGYIQAPPFPQTLHPVQQWSMWLQQEGEFKAVDLQQSLVEQHIKSDHRLVLRPQDFTPLPPQNSLLNRPISQQKQHWAWWASAVLLCLMICGLLGVIITRSPKPKAQKNSQKAALLPTDFRMSRSLPSPRVSTYLDAGNEATQGPDQQSTTEALPTESVSDTVPGVGSADTSETPQTPPPMRKRKRPSRRYKYRTRRTKKSRRRRSRRTRKRRTRNRSERKRRRRRRRASKRTSPR